MDQAKVEPPLTLVERTTNECRKMKTPFALWHRFHAWRFSRKLRKQHRELMKYIRRSAYEITAWKQDISLLHEMHDYHATRAEGRTAEPPEAENVVPMKELHPAIAAAQAAG